MLVPLDFSDVTPRVVGVATQMARATCESPLLLHVTLPDPPFVGYEPVPATTPFDPEADSEAEHQELELWKDRITGLNSSVSTLQMQGPAVEQILAAAEERHARMIVMGTHCHGALHDLLIGNVTHGVLHHARCPVTVVPPGHGTEAPTAIRSIATLVDFSDLTDNVIEQTQLLARAFGSRVTLIHALPPDPLVVDFAPPPRSEVEAEAERARLEHLAVEMRGFGLEVGFQETTGPVLDCLLDAVKDVSPDLIVMGSHGHGALYNLFVGSITAGIIQHAPCPVVVVPRTLEFWKGQRAAG
ncbi:MAG: universal stress protein [Verrucomicrobium sp.]